jgi:hypothetical protein
LKASFALEKGRVLLSRRLVVMTETIPILAPKASRD